MSPHMSPYVPNIPTPGIPVNQLRSCCPEAGTVPPWLSEFSSILRFPWMRAHCRQESKMRIFNALKIRCLDKEAEASYDMMLNVESKKTWCKRTYLQSRNSLTDLEMNLKGCQREGWGEGIVREFGMDRYRLTLLYLKWITIKDLLGNTGNSAQCLWKPGWKGVWVRMDTCICMAESLCCSSETITP